MREATVFTGVRLSTEGRGQGVPLVSGPRSFPGGGEREGIRHEQDTLWAVCLLRSRRGTFLFLTEN